MFGEIASESEKAGIAPTDELRSRRGKPVEHKSHSKDFLKQAPLLAPVDPADDGPQASLGESFGRRQKKDLFLNVQSEIEQLHDLCRVLEKVETRRMNHRSLYATRRG